MSNKFTHVNKILSICWENVTDPSLDLPASCIIDIPQCHFSLVVAITIFERPGNLWEALKFVLLSVPYLPHFVRPILPQVCELMMGFTICGRALKPVRELRGPNKMAEGNRKQLSEASWFFIQSHSKGNGKMQ